MRFICFYIFLGLSQVACSQQNTRINKTFVSEGSESFPSKNYTCQKLFYSDQNLVWEINYSYNGWQVYDSIYYEIKDSKYCISTFQPVYDEGSKTVSNYSVGNIDCEQEKDFSNKDLALISDQYFLSKPYLSDLNFLLQRNPINQGNVFKFKTAISPSLFSQYGIPYNELLSSFSFIVSIDNQIESDEFYFSNFTLKREYHYQESRLEEVVITLINKRTSSTSKFKEKFEIVN
jgi:hypothetical protein